VKIVAVGDSLTAGLGLPIDAAFPARMARALQAKGIAATIANAGVSGGTANGGLNRLAWSVPQGTDAVILELGANDMLRGVDPNVTKTALDKILEQLAGRHIPVLLAGMKASRNMGADYARAFDAVAADPKLNQADGMHPNPAGVDVIVKRMLPSVEELIARARKARGS